MERLSLYRKDEKGLPLRLTEIYGTRRPAEEGGTEIPEGTWAMAVAAFVIDSRGRILMTLRAPEKEAWPGYWENSGGASRFGETAEESMVRELFEETGIPVTEEDLEEIATVWFEQSVLKVYLIHKDWPLEDIVLQAGETTDARWCTVEEYEDVIARGLMCGPVKERYEALRETILEHLERWKKDSISAERQEITIYGKTFGCTSGGEGAGFFPGAGQRAH
ncbi:MAG: NUDIX domain-containing protein [Lachnospiraceae bacterium]|nr:NUDIX domain-containing protein [Lachnospiraceae bacterium]